MRIADVLRGKSIKDVITVTPEATVRELIGLMTEHNVGALVVSHDGALVEGIVSERDVVRRLSDDPALLEHGVAAIMTTDVHTCGTTDSLDDLMLLMTERRIRHVPVLDDERLVGIVSIGDVVKNRIQQLEFERDQLDSYVHQS